MAVSTRTSYPRALPYQQPVEAAAEAVTGWRRWPVRLVGAVAASIVVLTAVAVVLFNQNRNDAAPTDAAPAEAAKPQAKTAPPAPFKERYLEALGGLCASHLYQTYLNIGLLADGVEKEVYKLEEAEKMLASVADLMKLVDTHLAKVRQADLTADDQVSLERIKAVMGLLRLQTETLQGYWVSGEADDAAQYHEAREAAWKGLSKVLGLDEAAN